MPRTLRAQLILASAATLVLMSVLLLWGAQSAMKAALQEQFDRQLDVARPLLVAALAPLMAARDHAAVNEVVRQSVSSHGLAFLEVLDAEGRIVAATSRPAGDNGTTATEATPSILPSIRSKGLTDETITSSTRLFFSSITDCITIEP